MQRFIFSFTDLDVDDKETIYGFEFQGNSSEIKAKLHEFNSSQEFLDQCDDLEGDYGVHDFGTTAEFESIGFTSYEVREEDHKELVERWREFFVGKGYSVGPIKLLPSTYSYDQERI